MTAPGGPRSSTVIRVGLVGVHEFSRKLLWLLVNDARSMVIVGEASNDDESRSLLYDLHPDVLLIEGNGAGSIALGELLECYGEHGFEIGVVIAGSQIVPRKRKGVNALAVLPPSVDCDLTISAMKLVHAGFDIALSGGGPAEPPRTAAQSAINLLTERELSVLILIGTGASNQKIAERLYLSESMVKVHVCSVLDKLKLRNRVSAAAFGAMLNLASEPLLTV